MSERAKLESPVTQYSAILTAMTVAVLAALYFSPPIYSGYFEIALSVAFFIGIVGLYSKEVSSRKELEQALCGSEELFRALFEQADGGCMILRPTSSGVPVIVDANETACAAHGYTREQMIGRPVTDIDDEEGKKLCIERTKKIMSGTPLVIETEHLRRDGTSFPVSVYAKRINITNQQTFILTSERDISDIRATKLAREKAEELARTYLANFSHSCRLRTMGEMATGIAHELNQPLTAISLFAQSGKRLYSKGNSEKIPEIFDKLNQHAVRAGSIIARMQSMVKVGDSLTESADCRTLIVDIVELAEAEARFRNIDIEVDVGSNPAPVFVDAVQIQQVVLNLIRNAMEAMESVGFRDGNVIKIQVELEGKDRVKVLVSDSGCGISEQTKKDVFTPFATTKESGMGVGLSISQSIVVAHGGELNFKNRENCGAVFFFTLPLLVEESKEEIGNVISQRKQKAYG